MKTNEEKLYQSTLNWMYKQLPVYQRVGKSAYKANLDNTYALMDVLGHPYSTFKSVHVAGTNGKGSCSHMLASIYQEAGYKTGLYTSPHLKDFRERIRIDGAMVSKAFVSRFVAEYRQHFEVIKASFFEMTVGLAFAYFAEQKVDVAIIETGLGGRLDSTNVISPVLSLITNIGKDHTQFLGDNLEAIAAEKAGIIKYSVPVVVGEHHKVTDKVFEHKAKQMQSPICFAEDKLKVQKQGVNYIVESSNTVKPYRFALPLLGNYQQKNVLTVIAAAELLALPQPCIEKGLARVVENTHLLGRWQILRQKPFCIADTAHNKEGLIWVMQQLKEQIYKRLHIVLAVVNDKALDEILPLFPKEAIYYFAQAQIPRALAVEALVEAAKPFQLNGKAYTSIEEAYQQAVKEAEEEDMIYVGGSTFTVAEVL